MGVDPGLSGTGYAVLQADGAGLKLCEAGSIRTGSRQPLEVRLEEIFSRLEQLLEKWRPQTMVLEDLYADYSFPRTAIVMGHVRGAICLACRRAGARLVEVAPATLKQALTGSGRASKEQVHRAVLRLLAPQCFAGSHHVSDAVALALVGAFRGKALRC